MFNNINLELVNSFTKEFIVEFSQSHNISYEDTIWFCIDMDLD